MNKPKKIVLTTLPREGQFVDWTMPKFFKAKENKYMPLGILSLASNLPERHEVVVLDSSSEDWTIEETLQRIAQEKPDILGISAITRRAYSLNKLLEAKAAPYVAVGGPHATYYADSILARGADSVFVGPLADLEFRDAVETLPKGIVNCKTQINQINFPNREFLDIQKYFPKEFIIFEANKRLPMFSSIGCPHKCVFCNIQHKKVQRKSPEKVVDEMQYLSSIGAGSMHLLDDNFNVVESHLTKILDEMDRRRLSFEWSGRGEVKMSDDVAQRLSEHGFKRIHAGIEALDDNILRFFNKSSSVRQIYEFCETAKRHNIDVIGFFITGAPVETDEYRQKLPGMIEELGIKAGIFNMLFPLPDTGYYFNLLKDGFYKKDYWGEYMKNPTPSFEIPYPYGEVKKKKALDYINMLIKRFDKKNE